MSTLPGMPHLGTYRIVLADPPWSHEQYGQAKHGAAKSAYSEMPLDALQAMPVGSLGHPDGSLLFLWCTGAQAADGLHIAVAEAWGYRLRTRAFAWVKLEPRCDVCGHDWAEHSQVGNLFAGAGSFDLPGICTACPADRCDRFAPRTFFGPGNYTAQNIEDVWLGVRGDATWAADRAVKNVRQVVLAPTTRKHSEKPDEVQARIDRLWPEATPRLELFARRRLPTWAAWGNEAPDCDLVFGAEIGTTWPVPARAEQATEPTPQPDLFEVSP